MAEDKKEMKKAPAKDRWFSISGIRKEAKRVRWPKWKSEGENNIGVLRNSAQVIIFTAFFALFFVVCDFAVSFLLTKIG